MGTGRKSFIIINKKRRRNTNLQLLSIVSRHSINFNKSKSLMYVYVTYTYIMVNYTEYGIKILVTSQFDKFTIKIYEISPACSRWDIFLINWNWWQYIGDSGSDEYYRINARSLLSIVEMKVMELNLILQCSLHSNNHT